MKKTTTELQELKYIFNSDVKGILLLYINGNKSTIEIKDLFLKIKSREDKTIKGWSILEKFEEIKSFLQEQKISIEFRNESNDKVDFKTEVPFWQMNDKDIDTEDFNVIIKKIIELNEQASNQAETLENGTGNALPVPVIFDNEKYQRLLKRLEESNFEMFRKDNYVFFKYKEDESEDTLIEVAENGYNLLDINEFIIDISSGELIIQNKNEEKENEIEKVEDKYEELEM